MLFFFKTVIIWLLTIIFILLSVAFFTLCERHVLGAIQRRQGPNVIGFYGIIQPIADGVKLILKESLIPQSADTIIFVLAPIINFGLALCLWPVIPFNYGYVITDFDFGILYIFTVSSLSVHSIIMAGWASNNRWAFLGSLRSAAQMISYEIPLGCTIISVVLLSRSLNLTEIVIQQQNIWNILPLFFMFIIFFICCLAETSRHPFDLPEAESELVSGFNVEYAAAGFALFFLAEYSNIIAMSVLNVLFFFGGWFPLFFTEWFYFIPSNLWITIKILMFMLLFIIVRGTYPRYRYDQLMRLGWKVYLPISLAFILILACWLYTFAYINI